MDESVYLWRKQQLVRAGFNEAQASELAHGHCDLHEALELLAAHCPPDIAFDVLSD